MISGQHRRFPRLVREDPQPAWVPEPRRERLPFARAALAIVAMLLASWCMSVGMIWTACNLSGAC